MSCAAVSISHPEFVLRAKTRILNRHQEFNNAVNLQRFCLAFEVSESLETGTTQYKVIICNCSCVSEESASEELFKSVGCCCELNMMKYHTLSTSNLAAEAKKSTLTIYTSPDFLKQKMDSTETALVRCELEMAQRALKLQTRRCRQLVSEFTRKLQAKELEALSERHLRDQQLTKVLRSLLVFEARLKQEQTFIRHQLQDKDDIIQRQKKELKGLRNLVQFCNTCSQYYSPVSVDSCDSNWDSGSELFGSVLSEEESQKVVYEKNNYNKLNNKRCKKMYRRTTGTYFEVLKSRESSTESSTEDAASETKEEIEKVSERIEQLFETNNEEMLEETNKNRLISETIRVFDGGDGEQNDSWYASASDPEDDVHNVYRNNPVLECMNQILLQNINDSINSPPKSPELKNKTQKRVKFSDENKNSSVEILKTVEEKEENCLSGDYYETPIQTGANFYEVPQSIYSNDYEQILSKSGDSIQGWTSKIENLQENQINRMSSQKLTIPKCNNLDDVENKDHYYIDMDTTSSPKLQDKKIKTPPALPPKPANLVSKFKLQVLNRSCENLDLDSEPDYCSISELNLPTEKMIKSPEIKLNNSIYDPISLVQQNVQLAKRANISQINMLKKNEPEIPKLPQVSEIIIPEETEHISQDNYIKNNSQILKQSSRIAIGTSVSNLISNFNILSHKSPERHKMFSNFEKNYEKQTKQTVENKSEAPNFEQFDLSQNFEEFNLDDCEIEEFQPPDLIKEAATTDSTQKSNTSVEIVRATKDIRPQSIHSMQQLQKSLTSQRNNNLIPQTIPAPKNPEPSYEHFLECTGLSSKSILTPSRLLSNHKSMLKPKDIKLRSRAKNSVVFEQNNGTKYWSEPYL